MLALLRDDVCSITSKIRQTRRATICRLCSMTPDCSFRRWQRQRLSHINDGNFGNLFGDVEASGSDSIPLVSVVSSVEEGSRPWSR